MASHCKMFSLTGFCLRGSLCPDDHVRAASTGVLRSLRRSTEAASYDLFRAHHAVMKANIKRVEAEVKRQYAQANSLDLVVLMDCTGSMQPFIDAAKTSIVGIIDSVTTHHAQAIIRVGFVAYRDFCDGPDRLASHPLTQDVASVRDFIWRLRAFGGGDGPEDIPGGLEAVLQMEFTAAAKRVILVADAPCHGYEFHNMTDDSDSVAQAMAGPDIRAQMRTLARRGIDFTFIEIIPANTAKMVAILQHEYQKGVSRDGLAREFAQISLSQSGDAVRLGDAIASSASSSLSASKMRSVYKSSEKVLALSTFEHYGPSGKRTSSLAEICEDADSADDFVEISRLQELDWAELDELEALPAVRHSYHFRQGHDIDWASLDLKHTTQETTIKLLPACFARGAMRSAHAMYDLKIGKRFVAKVYYGRAAADIAMAGWSVENDVKSQMVAKRLAVEFSVLPQARDGVDFIFTSWYEVQHPECFGLGSSMAVFTAEPYIAGEYKKYNNNNGWIYYGGVAVLRETAQSFSHFTWQRTLGQLMVVDLQGVGCIFTDPQIHSLDKHAFGRGNGSEVGMAAFFATHTCNEVCLALGLLPFSDGRDHLHEARGPSDSYDPRGLEDKSMTCSCALCGEILQIVRSAFVHTYTRGRDVCCADCSARVAVREPRACVACGETIQVATFWYDMKGMTPPTSCKTCKAAAAAGELKRKESAGGGGRAIARLVLGVGIQMRPSHPCVVNATAETASPPFETEECRLSSTLADSVCAVSGLWIRAKTVEEATRSVAANLTEMEHRC